MVYLHQLSYWITFKKLVYDIITQIAYITSKTIFSPFKVIYYKKHCILKFWVVFTISAFQSRKTSWDCPPRVLYILNLNVSIRINLNHKFVLILKPKFVIRLNIIVLQMSILCSVNFKLMCFHTNAALSAEINNRSTKYFIK